MNRTNLPYRKDCEGYFLYKNKYVVAKNTGKGFIVFPGGGIDENETAENALLRESMEEAGIVCKGEIREVNLLNFDWGPDWAKTEKQKSRYNQFRGEEMHFFIGEVDEFVEPKGDPSDAWSGKKYLPIKEVIDIIEKEKPFSKDIKEYRIIQLKHLKFLLNQQL
jgi:8-oxo-dGTP pyrophosphatase MutT (NUDIX family)